MKDPFERRVHAAAVAAWWTLLIGVVFLTVVWFVFLGIKSGPPDWMERMWAGISPDQVFYVTLWLVGIWKLFLWTWAMLAVWLTLWARQLRKSAGGI